MSARAYFRLSLLLPLLMLALGFFWAPSLPERMASHWDLSGRPNGYASRTGVLLFEPLMTLLLVVGIPALVRMSSSRFRTDEGRKAAAQVGFALALLLSGIQLGILLANSASAFHIEPVFTLTLAVFAWALSGPIGNIPRNRFVGIRTATTLSSEESWAYAHRHARSGLRIAAVFFLFSAAGQAAFGWGGFLMDLIVLTVACLAPAVMASARRGRA